MSLGNRKPPEPPAPGTDGVLINIGAPYADEVARVSKARNPEEAAWQQHVLREQGETRLKAIEAELAQLETNLASWKDSADALYATAEAEEKAGRPMNARLKRDQADNCQYRWERNCQRRDHIVEEIARERKALRGS